MSKNVDFILDNLINEIFIPKSKGILTENKNDPLILYFLYHIPRLQSYSYLLTNEKILGVDFQRSFSYFQLKNYDIKDKQILYNSELNDIINYALNLSEIHNLLDDNSKLIEGLNKHEKLFNILSVFNKCDFCGIDKLCQKGDGFQIILKISLLSIPQLPNKNFAFFSEDKLLEASLIKGIDKQKKINEAMEAYNKNELNELTDKLFLFATIIEGFLWNLDQENNLMNFYVGNFYSILNNKNIHAKQDKIASHSFYLQPFNFYYYGKITISDGKKEQEKINNEVKKLFDNNFNHIVLFSKSIVSKHNSDSIQNWHEISNPLIPQSIAHGITSVCLPQKIGLFKESNNELQLIEAFECDSNDIPDHILLNKPWTRFKPLSNFNPQINDFNDGSIALCESKRQILIRVKNALNLSNYIVIEFFDNPNFSLKNLISKYQDFQYTFKAFIEKLQYIHRSVSLNVNPDLWYKKAFCNLYEEADRVRFDKNNNKIHNKYRLWEKDYFNKFLENRNDVIIFDMGCGYGRLEETLFGLPNGYKIKTIYAIDQNNNYLKTTKRCNDSKIEIICCDFRNIDLMIKNDIKADLICFIYTTFGCFKDEHDNSYTLKKAYELLKDDGVLLIEQFNPYKKPEHCNTNVASFDFPNDKGDKRLIKTSNFNIANETFDYALYHGNYIYFDLANDNEKIIKCDTYELRLYTEKWFYNEYKDKCKFKYFNSEINKISEDKVNGDIMIVEIQKRITKEDCNELNKELFATLEDNYVKKKKEPRIAEKFNKMNHDIQNYINSGKNVEKIYSDLITISEKPDIEERYNAYISIKTKSWEK